ncbi:MAG TPA: hypothetical protein VD996_07585 [Chitinophagaceae bacterium]|nr:hypothetical protein [Chitinophagaceae bacterium]
MRSIFAEQLIAGALTLTTLSLSAQDPEALKILVGGTFAKPKIIPKMEKLAIAQASIYFKTATTREVYENERGGLLGGRKSGGGAVAGRITAYLETTDGELTEQDYQELADNFYKYFNQKLQAAGVSTVDWNTITNTTFYKEDGTDLEELKKDMDAMKKKGQIYAHINANKGSTLYRYNIAGGMFNTGFAFGKAKRAEKFSEQIGAPAIYMHLVVDFADIWLDGDVKTGTSNESTMFYTKVTTSKKWKMDAKVGADMKVSTAGTSMLYNEKSQAEILNVVKDISSNVPFASGVSADASKEVLRKKDNIFAKDFNMTPMVVSTTKAQYKAAAAKALENYADTFVAKLAATKK